MGNLAFVVRIARAFSIGFTLSAAALLIPVAGTGAFVELTWAANAFGLVLAIILVATEWLARSWHPSPGATVVGSDAESS